MSILNVIMHPYYLNSYSVAPEMIESQMIHVNPSQVISFDLNKKDIFRYVHRYVLYNFCLLFVNS